MRQPARDGQKSDTPFKLQYVNIMPHKLKTPDI